MTTLTTTKTLNIIKFTNQIKIRRFRVCVHRKMPSSLENLQFTAVLSRMLSQNILRSYFLLNQL